MALQNVHRKYNQSVFLYGFLSVLFCLVFLYSAVAGASVISVKPPQEVGRDARHSSANNSSDPDSALSRIKLEGKWLGVSPSLLGFQETALERTAEEIGRMQGVYSLLVARRGFLVLERYFRDGNRFKPHNMKSASKSLLSILTGIAVDQGLLEPDQPIGRFLPEVKNLADTGKAGILVRHLLTMTSGLEPTSYQAYNQWVKNGDWIKNALEKPLVAEPGTTYQYSTANTHLLSAVLTAATGMSTYDFANRYLFGPMGITIGGWDTDPQGIYQGGNNLSMMPRDMARIGQFYLDGGMFGNRQLVSRQWVDISTSATLPAVNEVYGGYGFLWYLPSDVKGSFVAVGYGGQYIYVSPAHETVIVVTSDLESKGRAWEKKLFMHIRDGILGKIDAGPDLPFPSWSELAAQTVARVNLRSTADEAGEVVETLDIGRSLQIMEQSGAWLHVRTGGTDGWVSTEYIAVAKTVPVLAETRNKVKISKVEAPEQEKQAVGGESSLELVGQLRDRLAVSEKNQKELADKAKTIQEQFVMQQQIAAQSEASRQGLVAELASVRKELEIHQQKALDSGAGRDALQAERDRLRLQIAELNENLAAEKKGVEKERIAALEQISMLKASLADTQTKSISQGNEMDRVREEYQKLEKQYQAAASELGSVRRELETERQAAQTAQTVQVVQTAQGNELDKVREEYQELQMRYHAAASELDFVRRELETQRRTNQTVQSTQTALDALQPELEGLRTQIDGLKTKLAAEQSARNSLNEELAALREDDIKRKSLASAEEGLTNQLALAREQNSMLQTALADAKEKRTGQDAELDKVGKELLELRGRYESTANELASLRTKFQNQHRVIDEAVAMRGELEAGLSETNSQVQSLRDALQAEQTTRENLKAELAKLHQKSSEQVQAVQDEHAARKAVEEDLNEANDQIIKLKIAMAGSTDSSQGQGRELERVGVELQELGQRHQDSVAEVTTLRGELQRSRLVSLQARTAGEIAAQEQPALEVSAPLPGEVVVSAPKPETVPAPAEVKTPVLATKDQSAGLPDLAAVEPFVLSWKGAWESRDVEQYLAHYSSTFNPPADKSLSAWRESRRQRLQKPGFIKVEIKNLTKEWQDSSRVLVTFEQHYSSDTFSDRIKKELQLQYEKSGWKIVSEMSN